MKILKITDKLYLYIWLSALSFSLFFFSTTISNAGTSISYSIAILMTIFIYYHQGYKLSFPDKRFLYPYLIFFCLLFISTIAIADKISLYYLWKYFTWSFPFFLFYYASCVKCNCLTKVYQITTFEILSAFSAVSLYLFLTSPLGIRITGFSNQANLYAILIESVLPYGVFSMVMIWKNKLYIEKYGYVSKILPCFIVVLGIISLLLTQSRGACAGFVISFLLLLAIQISIRKNHFSLTMKKIFLACIVMFGIVGILFLHTGYLSRRYDGERILLWKSSYQMWQDHKLLGVGFSNWKAEYDDKYISPRAKEPNLTMPHNVFISFFSRTGLIGGAGYVIFVLGELAFLIQRMKNDPNDLSYQAMFWAFLTITLHGFVDAGITNKFAMQIFFSYSGIVLGSHRLLKKA